MGAETAAATGEQTVQKFRSPGTVIARFVARSVSKTAAIVGYGFAIYVVSSIYGFTKTYATQASRETLAKLFGNNAGLQALFGVAHHIDTVRGFTAWRTLGILTIVGAIWGLAVATKRFRGEEEQGRWELFLSGQTTSRQGALNNMAGLGVGLFIIFALVAIVTGIIGNVNHQHFGASEILFYTVALVASTAVFMAVGALVSQIMPTRRRAVGTAAALFGVAFLLRAIGDASKSAHWLTYLSPLGWIENTRPLTGSSPLWLIPVLGLIVVLGALTVYLAGRRDLGASLVPDKDTARPRTRFLNTTFGLALRETRAGVIAWVAALGVAGLGMGAVAKAAGEAMAASTGAHKFFTNITSQRAIGAQTYLGVVFLMVMTVLMAMAASGVNSMREDEAEGYLDNLLVRPVSRLKWLRERLGIVVVSVALVGVTTGLFTWLGTASQHAGLSFGKVVQAGVNSAVPAAVIVGVGILMLGIKPRWASAVMYAVIGWSFLLELIGPIVNLNHWVLDTSLLHHVALAPAADPRWSAAAIMLGIGVAGCALGAIVFNRRDLAGQ